jgi:hypothetical protein
MRLRIFYASRDCRPISQFGFNELRGTSQSFRGLCVPTHGRCRLVVYVTVRREKALDFSGCNSRPGTGSLHPVAIEAAAEATKLSEPSM